MDKIVFLDFDGVLNCFGTKDRIDHPYYPGFKMRGLDDFRIKLVSDLCVKTEAKIVISSTWRLMMPLDDLKTLLYSRGLDSMVEIVGITPEAFREIGLGFQPKRGERGDDIQLWLEENGYPKHYLILDDIDTKHEWHQIQTEDRTGFFKGHMKRAIEILSQEDDIE